MKLYFKTKGQGPPLVMLHGWGFHSYIWDNFIQTLCKEFCITTIDLAGYGRSRHIKNASIDAILDIAPKDAIWIGWSLGGLIATKIALAYPHRVSKLVCIASSPRFLNDKEWPGVEFSVLKGFKENLLINYDSTFQQFLAMQFFGRTRQNNEHKKYLASHLFQYGKPTLNTLNADLDLLMQEDLRLQLSHLTCPVLYLLGQNDMLVPASVVKPLKKHTSIRCVVLSKAGHALF